MSPAQLFRSWELFTQMHREDLRERLDIATAAAAATVDGGRAYKDLSKALSDDGTIDVKHTEPAVRKSVKPATFGEAAAAAWGAKLAAENERLYGSDSGGTGR